MAVSIKLGTCGGIGYTTIGSLTFFHPALCFGVDKFLSAQFVCGIERTFGTQLHVLCCSHIRWQKLGS